MPEKRYPWYKWYPDRSMTSLRWRSLSFAERGIFRELYDVAALAPVCGVICSKTAVPESPDSLDAVARLIGCPIETLRTAMKHFELVSLIVGNGTGFYVFPDWQRHQRKTPAANRHDGTSGQKRGNIGATSGQERGATVAPDVEVEVELEVELEKEREKEVASLTPAGQAFFASATTYSRPFSQVTSERNAAKRLANQLGETYGAENAETVVRIVTTERPETTKDPIRIFEYASDPKATLREKLHGLQSTKTDKFANGF